MLDGRGEGRRRARLEIELAVQNGKAKRIAKGKNGEEAAEGGKFAQVCLHAQS